MPLTFSCVHAGGLPCLAMFPCSFSSAQTTHLKESPPAWTQEAYRPRRIKYSICFPKWGQVRWGYPKWGTHEQGVPQARSDRGYPRWVTSQQGYPLGWTWLGYSLPRPGRGTLLGVDRQIDGWMDRHVWKHYLPVVLRTRSVKWIVIICPQIGQPLYTLRKNIRFWLVYE